MNATKPRALHNRPAAGSPASNQYGTFAVSYASEKQTNFIKALMDRKDLSALTGTPVLDVDQLRDQVANQQVNKKAASAIIDRLLALPDASAAPAQATAAPATDKQKEFIRSLLAERTGNDDAENMRNALNELRVTGRLTAAAASEAITFLLAIPKVAPAEVEAGVYVLPTGQMVRVYLGQQSGQMLAKVVLDDGELEYVGKAARVLVPGTRKATVEEVGAWGKTTGNCLVCGRALDDPESVDRGIGPVCYGRMA